MKKVVTSMALLLALCLSACTAMKTRLTSDDIDAMDNVRHSSAININGVTCDEENGLENFEILLQDLEYMYNGELKGGEMKFVVLWWYRNGYGGYLAALPPIGLYHSDIFSIGFLGIAELGIMTLKSDIDTRDVIGFSRYNGHGFCAIGTLENYEFFGHPDYPEDEAIGILKEYSWMIGPFKVYTERERVDFYESE
ncbi:MAG: hypothetical protein ACYS8W_12855 [Planctomycetota bacterium]|jgi:hypothetical protein